MLYIQNNLIMSNYSHTYNSCNIEALAFKYNIALLKSHEFTSGSSMTIYSDLVHNLIHFQSMPEYHFP